MDHHLLTVRRTTRIMKIQKIPKILYYSIRVVYSRQVEIRKEKEIQVQQAGQVDPFFKGIHKEYQLTLATMELAQGITLQAQTMLTKV